MELVLYYETPKKTSSLPTTEVVRKDYTESLMTEFLYRCFSEDNIPSPGIVSPPYRRLRLPGGGAVEFQ